MKAYLLKQSGDSEVVLTDGVTVKFFPSEPPDEPDSIDLNADDATERLKVCF